MSKLGRHSSGARVDPAAARRQQGRLRASLAGALALLVLVFLGLALGRQWYDSLLARVDQHRVVHRDASRVDSGVRPRVRSQVALSYRRQDGETLRVLVDADRYSAFVREYTRVLEAGQLRLRRQVRSRLERDLDRLFLELEARNADFADWYFAYPTSYGLLWQALVSTGRHALSSEAQALNDAVAYDLEQYLQDRYQSLVLKPELTDPRLLEIYRDALDSAHQGYLRLLSGLRAEFQLFVARESDLVEQGGGEVRMELDWESQFNKLDAGALERGSPEVARSGLLALGGAALGKGLTGKALAGGAGKGLFAKLASPFVAKGALAAGGGAVGVLAGPAGAALGAGVGLGIDYLINEGVEMVQREQLEADLADALAATRREWGRVFQDSLNAAIEAWFGDTLRLLVAFEP